MVDAEKTNLLNHTKEELIQMLFLAWKADEDNHDNMIEMDYEIEILKAENKKLKEQIQRMIDDQAHSDF